MARWRHLLAALSTLQIVLSHPYATGLPGYSYPNPHDHSHEEHSSSAGEHLDVIKDLEIGPTQVVVVTSKEGSADKLRVRIELTDLHDNRKLPPTDLSGLWLLISRGRYTIPFLKPDRWYGLNFRSENIVNNQIVAHTENRLIRTLPRQGNGTDLSKMFDIKLHRNLEGVESLENLYMTARWSGPERVNFSELVVKVRVECAKSNTDEAIHLNEKDDSVTIEISMDHRYELEELNKTMHEYKANITPLQCKRVCWKPTLEVDDQGTPFIHEFEQECRNISGTTAKTFLRNFKEYAIEDSAKGPELVVHTEVGEPHEQAFVTLSALRLDQNESEVAYRSYSTAQSDGVFRLPLEEDGVYAVSYEYTKTKPFHYSAKDHFVIETSGVNLTRASHPPVELLFEHDNQTDSEKKMTASPVLILARGKRYDNRRITVNMDPMCGTESHQITLTDYYPHHEINATNILCSQNTNHYFCDPQHNYTKCSPIFCYTLSLSLDTTPYNTEPRCLNVTQHFNLNNISQKPIWTLLVTLILMLR